MERFEELSLEEMQDVAGGGIWATIVISMTAVFIYEIVNDWGNNIKAFNEGYESFK